MGRRPRPSQTSSSSWPTTWASPTSAATAARSRRRTSTRSPRNGLRFTQFYNTARCWPTRGALLTGYYAQQIHRDALPERRRRRRRACGQPWARLLPDFLKPAGYRCYHSGKWHIDGKVLDGGFDRSLNMNNQGNYFTAAGNSIDDKPVTPAADETGYYATIATADHAIECLKDHAANHAGPAVLPLRRLHRARTSRCTRCRRTSPSIATNTSPAGRRCARRASAGRRKWASSHTTLSALERDVGPPYAFPDAMQEARPRRGQPPAAVERTHRRAAPLPGDEDGDPRRDGGPHGPGDRPHHRAAQGDERLREHAHLLRLRQRRQRRDHGARRRPRSGRAARQRDDATSASAPAFPAPATRRFAGTRPGSTKAASARR